MTFQFDRDRALPLFLNRHESLLQFSKRAGCSPQSCWRAVTGQRVHVKVVAAVAKALGIDALDYIDFGKEVQADED